MHPAISINSLSTAAGSFAANVEMVARIGVAAISPGIDEVEAIGTGRAQRVVRDAGLAVATFTHRAFGFGDPAEIAAQRDRLSRTIDIAAALGAGSITMTTGGRGRFTWIEAAERFAEAIAPFAAHARAAGIALAVEPTSHLYADASIAHRLADLVAVCTRADIGLGIDLFACWFDSDIEQAIVAAVPRAQVIQVSDYVAGDRGLPCRAVPGDGIAQIDRLIRAIVAAGYRGWFDLEIIGPRILAEGPAVALPRAAARLGAMIGPAFTPHRSR